MISALMYIINGIMISWNAILIIATLIGTLNYNIFILFLFLAITILNFISLKSLNKENAKLEFAYFNVIKECSRLIKKEEFENLYHYLRKFRKTTWYKNLDKENSYEPIKNLNGFYDTDEFRVDYFEK